MCPSSTVLLIYVLCFLRLCQNCDKKGRATLALTPARAVINKEWRVIMEPWAAFSWLARASNESSLGRPSIDSYFFRWSIPMNATITPATIQGRSQRLIHVGPKSGMKNPTKTKGIAKTAIPNTAWMLPRRSDLPVNKTKSTRIIQGIEK